MTIIHDIVIVSIINRLFGIMHTLHQGMVSSDMLIIQQMTSNFTQHNTQVTVYNISLVDQKQNPQSNITDHHQASLCTTSSVLLNDDYTISPPDDQLFCTLVLHTSVGCSQGAWKK